MYITSGMAQKSEVSKPWFTDLMPAFPLLPARKKKKSKAGRKISEMLALKGWASYCPKWKSKRLKKSRKNNILRQENCEVDNFEEQLEEFVVLNKTHPVDYQSIKLEKADPNPKIQSRTPAFCFLQHCMSCPVPKVASSYRTILEYLQKDPVNEKYWNDIIQRKFRQEEGKPSISSCISPDDSLKLLRCGDVHPNPGPPKTKNPLDLGSNQKRWLVIAAAIVNVMIPSLRPFLDAGLNKVYTTFQSSHGIAVQTSGKNLPGAKYPASNYKLINKNNSKDKKDYDFRVKSHIELAKLYLKDSYMANFTAINDECDPSAVLNLLELLPHVPGSGFTPAVQNAAENVRKHVRNPWAHCNLAEWNTSKFQDCFQRMDSLLKECGLTGAAGDLKELEQKGVKGMDLNLGSVIDDLKTRLLNWKTVQKQDVDKIQKNLDEIRDALKRIEQGVVDLSKDQHEMKECLKKGQEDIREELQDMKKGQKSMEEALSGLKGDVAELKKQDKAQGQKRKPEENEDCSSVKKAKQDPRDQLKEQLKSTVLSETKYMDKLFASPEFADIKIDSRYIEPVVVPGRETYNFCNMDRSEVVQAYPCHKGTAFKKTEQLFEPSDSSGEPRRTILLTGRAGIGKTLFVQKMARDWAQGDLFDDGRYQFIFFFTFRQLNFINRHLMLHEFLNCAAFSPQLENDMFDHICQNPKSVLFIMDGYDEFNCCIEEKDIRELPEENKMSVSAVCAKLAKGKLFPGATVVITTRPDHSQQLEEIIHFDICAEILGFTPDKVEEYITHFFEDNIELKETVLSHIGNHKNLLGFCYVPVTCFLMCSYLEWSYSSQGLQLPDTVTDLYEGVLDMFLLKHHPEFRGQKLLSKRSLSDNVKRMLDILSKVALQFLDKKKYVFSEKELAVFGLSEDDLSQLFKSGLLHCMPGCRTGPFSIESSYCFIHLTLQEFLAAQCLVEQRKKGKIQRHSSTVQQFVCGILRKIPSSEKITELITAIVNKRWTKAGFKVLSAINCMYEYQNRDFIKNYVDTRGVTEIALEKVDLNVSDYAALSFLINSGCSSLTILDLAENTIGDAGAEHIGKWLCNAHCSLTTLDLRNNKIGDAGAEHIGKGLCNPHCSLTTLHLIGNFIGAAGADYIGKGLCNPHCSLTRLDLSGNNIGDAGAEHIGKGLSNPHCSLTTLDLRNNRIGDEGAEHIGKGLCNPHCSLTTLILGANIIGDAGVEHIGKGLCNPHCSLTRLSLFDNKIGDAGAEHIGKGLCNPHCSLTILEINSNKIGDAGAEHIGKGLCNPHCSLTTLDLRNNRIGDEGAEHIGKGLCNPHCSLTTLILGANIIGDAGVEHIGKGLCNPHCSLTRLSLFDNKIGDAGAEHIGKGLCNPHCSLTALDLQCNKIDDAGAEHIGKGLCNPHCSLTKLLLQGNKISRAGAEHIEKAISNPDYKSHNIRFIV